MILVLVQTEGNKRYYLVTFIEQVYQRIAKDGDTPDIVEVLTDNVIIDVKPQHETPEAFLTKCCIEFEISLAELRSVNKIRRLSNYRKVISFLLRKRFDIPLVDIADMLHRDHTGIIYNIKCVEKQLRAGNGGPLLQLIERIENNEP